MKIVIRPTAREFPELLMNMTANHIKRIVTRRWTLPALMLTRSRDSSATGLTESRASRLFLNRRAVLRSASELKGRAANTQLRNFF